MEFVIRLAGTLLLWFLMIQFVMNTNRRITRDTRMKVLNRLGLSPRKYNVKFAERVLKIKSWKDKMPQMSDWSKNVYDKSSLNDSKLETLKVFQEEFEKGIYAHGLPVLLSVFPILFAWDNVYVQVLNLIGLSLQGIYLMIQRYNYFRFSRIITFKERKA